MIAIIREFFHAWNGFAILKRSQKVSLRALIIFPLYVCFYSKENMCWTAKKNCIFFVEFLEFVSTIFSLSLANFLAEDKDKSPFQIELDGQQVASSHD